jgi:hypothetical protein
MQQPPEQTPEYIQRQAKISLGDAFVAEGARTKLVTTFLIEYCSVILQSLYELYRICEQMLHEYFI